MRELIESKQKAEKEKPIELRTVRSAKYMSTYMSSYNLL